MVIVFQTCPPLVIPNCGVQLASNKQMYNYYYYVAPLYLTTQIKLLRGYPKKEKVCNCLNWFMMVKMRKPI